MRSNLCLNIGDSNKVTHLLYGLIGALLIAASLLLALAFVLYKFKSHKSCPVCKGWLFAQYPVFIFEQKPLDYMSL